jgi:hypothetical protein
VLVPPEAVVRADGLGDPLGVLRGRHGDVERGGDLHPVRCGQRERLLLGQREAPGVRVVGDVAAGGLPGEPLAHVALPDPGFHADLARRRRHDRQQCPVQPEPVTDHRVDGVEARPHVHDEPPEEVVQLALVDCHLRTSLPRSPEQADRISAGPNPGLAM